ncbi:MAG: alpha/beta hydrolase family protein [Verrucomicrobiota bacterium JB022]|nr:alpha/beta hydrolase family protein [Verrucomicrobiota bacterium JB022]
MAFLQVNFFSEVLEMASTLNVILPERTHRQIGLQGRASDGPHPTLYLLHGLSDDHTIWCRRTSIERYVAPLGLAVVMPNVHRSFYTDMHSGGRYWTYVSEEVPEVARSFFRLSAAREDNFVAGLSMGGYGAFKLALRQPEKWGAAASLSGALDLANRPCEERIHDDFVRIFGTHKRLVDSPDNLLRLIDEAEMTGRVLPRLWACCGRDDFLLPDNRRFIAHAHKCGVPVEYVENEGAHDWGYWDTHIQTALKWMLASGAEA